MYIYNLKFSEIWNNKKKKVKYLKKNFIEIQISLAQ